MIVDRRELASILGLTTGRISNLAQAGQIPKLGHGQYDLGACLQAYLQFRLTPAEGSSSVNESRAQLYEEQTIKTHLEADNLRRSVVPADHYLADSRAVVSHNA